MNNDGNVAAVGAEKDILLTINGTWFSRLAIFSSGAIQAFCTVVRWLRGRVIEKGYTRRELVGGVIIREELDAFIDSALEILPQRIDSVEEDRAVLIAEGIITADGELAPEYRSVGDSGKLQGGLPLALPPPAHHRAAQIHVLRTRNAQFALGLPNRSLPLPHLHLGSAQGGKQFNFLRARNDAPGFYGACNQRPLAHRKPPSGHRRNGRP